MTEERKQAAKRLCRLTLDSHKEYCLYKRSPLYKRDWDRVRTGDRKTPVARQEPMEVKHAIRRLLRVGFKTWEE